jgi:hypothetical protein
MLTERATIAKVTPSASEGSVTMSRSGIAALAALFVLACGPAGQRPGSCSTSAQCPAETLCRSGSCVASAPPVAELGAPGAELLYSHRIVEIDSSALDPDGDDAVTRWSWRATTVDAPCDAEVVAGAGPVLQLWAGCAGTFDVELVVTDSAGVQSAPAVKRITLSAEPNPVRVVVPAVVEGHHRCAGSPLRCVAIESDGTGSIPLVAGWERAEGRVEIDWSCAAPEGSDARLSLSNAAIPNPRLTIETDGTAISRDYRCTATGTDARRTTDRAAVVVRVLNRPPDVRFDVAEGTVLREPLLYDAESDAYRAIILSPPVLVSDPDGDPLQARPDGTNEGWLEDGLSVVEIFEAEHMAMLEIFLPVGSPELLHLPPYRLEYVAEDVNGGRAVASLPIDVGAGP